MKYLRYYSEFRSRRNALYRVEIWQDSATAFTPKSIVLSGEPVELEWSDVDKLEPVHSSSATLNMISMSDREFVDLYTVEVNAVRLDIYRNKTLYWSGNLDPEIFEEPYAYKDRYVTTVTFSDFAILDRQHWDGRGIFSMRQVLDACLSAAGFQFIELIQHISTKISASDVASVNLNEIHIIGENFYDEDDESMTLREVLDEILRPFALRIIQKNGRVYLYDLNELYAGKADKVVWAGTDANMEADGVYNNVKVTFSPYADGSLIDGALQHEDVATDQPVGSSGTLIRVDDSNNAADGFRIVCETASNTVGDIATGNGAVLCRVDPEYSGSKEAAVMWGYKSGDTWIPNAPSRAFDGGGMLFQGKTIITTTRCYLGQIPNPGKFQLRVTMDVLFDTCYNPFEPKGRHNQEGNWKKLQDWCNYGYVPIDLTVYDGAGKSLYYFYNDGVRQSNSYVHTANNSCWKPEPGVGGFYNHHGQAWLCFYDNDRKTASGFGGWKTNKPIIGWYSDGLPSKFKLLSTGEYIPLPPVNGFIELRVYSGVEQYDNDGDDRIKDIYSRLRWLMYRNPKIEIVKANGVDFDKEDIEDSAWLNKSAKEDLGIDTIFGTMPEAVPSARGLLFKKNGTPFGLFARGGHTDRLERLLIGTVYSQYATRHHILSGTVELLPEFTVLTDTNEPGQYISLSEIQHLALDESKIKMVQFAADDYDAIEYK